MKQTYRVRYKHHIVEGRATSAQNACRKAFKLLINEGLIKTQPKTDINNPTSFENTSVEVIND